MMNSDPSASDTGLSEVTMLLARVALAIAGCIAVVFLAATAVGYISTVAESGSADAKDIAIIGAIAAAMFGVAFAIWRFWPRASSGEPQLRGPGEARTRQRNRTQLIYIGFAAVIGGVIGLATGFFDEGNGSLFGGNWEQLKLPPLLAIGIAGLLLAGFLALPLYGFRMIDDYKREQNLVAFTGGCISVIAGFPVWAVLHAGGFLPPPHAFGIFAIAYVSMMLSFLYARWRL